MKVPTTCLLFAPATYRGLRLELSSRKPLGIVLGNTPTWSGRSHHPHGEGDDATRPQGTSTSDVEQQGGRPPININ